MNGKTTVVRTRMQCGHVMYYNMGDNVLRTLIVLSEIANHIKNEYSAISLTRGPKAVKRHKQSRMVVSCSLMRTVLDLPDENVLGTCGMTM